MTKLECVLTAALGSGLSLACGNTQPKEEAATVRRLVQRSFESNSALMRGDVDRYLSLLPIGRDFTLMSPFGGPVSHGVPSRLEWERIGKFFKNGVHEQELVEAYSARDMVVLALIERARVEVGGLPMQEWALRVTLVYRRDGDEWYLVHRHADPLVGRISVPDSAKLARGERREQG